MDQDTRNHLQRATQQIRRILEEEFAEQLEGTFDVLPSGKILPEPGKHLDARQRLVRQKLVDALEHIKAGGQSAKEAIAQYTREAAFTFLNRFVALRMLEARGILQECVSHGDESSGFKEFCGLAPGLSSLEDGGYRLYLESLFDELSVEVKVLFDRRDAASLLWPRRAALTQVLDVLARPELEGVWSEDETIGWVYQYYNDPAERKKMRDESAAPRNSRELAVRNQFFTPRYVVEFLTDNTLGRIWYEMTKGETLLVDQCRYLVRRPKEIFLDEGENAPESAQGDAEEALSQEELLKQPVHIAHRSIKDPREIRMLDPACGSMHFGLYAFDLFEAIYEEAWDKGLCPALQEAYPDKVDYLRDVPRLIIQHNIHGVDIDPRAAQIAGLSLWLRAQKAWKDIPASDRPRIQRSNIVCAEPMPGSSEMLEEFVATLDPPILGELVRSVFEKMKLAGEAGALLKIEEQIIAAANDAREDAQREGADLFKHLQDEGDDFFENAEERIYAALRDYAESTTGGDYQRRLFAEDAAHGFAFIDLCRQRYDAVVMNPPFGRGSVPSQVYLDQHFGDSKGDVYKIFVEAFQPRLVSAGYLGIISSRTGFFLGQSRDWRRRVILRQYRLLCVADLGIGVLDAMVETAAYVLRSINRHETEALIAELMSRLTNLDTGKSGLFSTNQYLSINAGLKRHQADQELRLLLNHGKVIQPSLKKPNTFRIKSDSEPKASRHTTQAFDCFRLLESSNKAVELSECINSSVDRRRFLVRPKMFDLIPNSPFAYWIPESCLQRLHSLPRVEPTVGQARRGPSAGDNARRLRTWWEVPSSAIGRNGRWVPYAKGGKLSPYYSDIPLVISWSEQRRTFFDFIGRPGRWISRPECVDDFFRKGVTWPLRTSRFAPSVLPEGCVFSVRGQAFVGSSENIAIFLAVANSNVFDRIFKLALGRSGHPEFLSGTLQGMPWPQLKTHDSEKIVNLALTVYSIARCRDSGNEYSHVFESPDLYREGMSSIKDELDALRTRFAQYNDEITHAIEQTDAIVREAYGFTEKEYVALLDQSADSIDEYLLDDDSEATVSGNDKVDVDPANLINRLFSYLVGIAFGRWVYREREEIHSVLTDRLFDPLPNQPPAVATNNTRNGGQWILVDDASLDSDIVRCVTERARSAWGEKSEFILAEAAAILSKGMELRAYFCKNFFDFHLGCYSQAGRKSPIYWQLSTPSASYSVWLYYHRFTKDTFYKVLNEYHKPKLDYERQKLSRLQGEGGADPTASERKKIENQEKFVAELASMAEEVERVAPLWKPNLNDGVIINFAPLWRLVPQNKSWQKECKKVWDKLVKGEYDWAHLAMHLWPERVVPKCVKDASLAIAHGLDDVFWEKDEKDKYQAKETPDGGWDPIVKQLIDERTSPAVKAALKSLLEAPAPTPKKKTRRRKASTS